MIYHKVVYLVDGEGLIIAFIRGVGKVGKIHRAPDNLELLLL